MLSLLASQEQLIMALEDLADLWPSYFRNCDHTFIKNKEESLIWVDVLSAVTSR